MTDFLPVARLAVELLHAKGLGEQGEAAAMRAGAGGGVPLAVFAAWVRGQGIENG